VDQLGILLKEKGIANYLIEVGGSWSQKERIRSRKKSG